MTMRWHMKRFCRNSAVKEQMIQREKDLGMEAKVKEKHKKRRAKFYELYEDRVGAVPRKVL